MFEKKILINTSIPGFKSQGQLETIGRLIRSLSLGSNIVELGSCAGRGTWTISQNAPLFSKVYAIDTWNDPNLLRGKGQCLENSTVADKTYFLSQVEKCRNVIAIQGDAREIQFKRSVHCLVIDLDNGPGRNDHFTVWEKWQPFLARKALLIGANYFPNQRDDEVSFAEFIRSQAGNLSFENGIWWSHFHR